MTRRSKGKLISQIVVSLCVVVLLSALLLVKYNEVSTFVRWSLHSKAYKTEVLAQSSSIDGQLKHIEWDGWGFAGADTTVYLVFDPSDSLATSTGDHSGGKIAGIPCEVPLVHRLESHWYTVMFYTNTDWDHCI
jgi:hypothetical protein